MLQEKVGIYLRITTSKGKRFVKPHPTRDGYILDAEGKAERRPDGVYYLRYEHTGRVIAYARMSGVVPPWTNN